MEGFLTIVNDLKNDLRITFPELTETLNDLSDNIVYDHCVSAIPPLFLDILYEKEELFDEPRYLLPNIDFSLLMKDETLSPKTRTTLWKYLQLILFYTIEKTPFEQENSVNEKMEKTMEEMRNMFNESDISNTFQNMFKDISNDDYLNSNNMKDYMDTMMNGKIGSIAKEIANETAQESNTNPEDFMKEMMSNPQKIMGLVQSIGSKLETKLKSSEVDQEDMMKESMQMMEQMKNMPGLKEMMSKMGLNDKKMDFKSMSQKMDQLSKQEATKERMRKKMEQKEKEKAETNASLEKNSDGDFVFKTPGQPPKKSNRKKNKKSKKE
ncbi:hypothetical protein 162322344 [Organic Lake phycodnavirus 1]|nr:hypothetical protein 162322344 [Organic Lake phycodnavirus 1]